MTRSLVVVLALAAVLGSAACSAELGEPCSLDSQCPTGAVCRNNLYLEVLCRDGQVPIQSSGPDGYCTHVCAATSDCQDVPNSNGCQDDPKSNRMLCLPDCSKYPSDGGSTDS